MADTPLVPDAGTAPAPATPEPVTPVTPDAPTEPTGPVSLSDASDAWLQSDSPAERVRGPDGKFVAKEPTPATEEGVEGAQATPDGSAPDAAAATPDADDPAQFIEARRGDEVVKLHKDTLVPMTRKGVTTWEPIEKVQREGMLKVDYDAGKREQKEYERTLRATEARLDAREAQLTAEREQLKAAMTNEEAFADYQQHLHLMETSPRYKAAFEAKAERDEMAADAAAETAIRQQEQAQEAISVATSWVDDALARHPGVDRDRVLTVYGEALAADPPRARLHPSDVERIVANEASIIAKAMTPLQQEMEAMKAKVAAMEAEAAAARKNGTTTHALNRARTIPTGPAGGLPVAPGRRDVATPTGARDLGSMGDAWVRGG